MANAWGEPLVFELPAADGIGSHWGRWIDPALPRPDDIAAGWREAPAVTSPRYRVGACALVVLVAALRRRPPCAASPAVCGLGNASIAAEERWWL